MKSGIWKIEWLEGADLPYTGHNPKGAKPQTIFVDPEQLVCVICASKVLAEMAFLYLKGLPVAELPGKSYKESTGRVWPMK